MSSAIYVCAFVYMASCVCAACLPEVWLKHMYSAFCILLYGLVMQSTPTDKRTGQVLQSTSMTSLDDSIAQLNAMDGTNKRGEEILAAATTLRDSKGRDRLVSLRKMAST